MHSYYPHQDGKDFDLSADILDVRYLDFFVHCHPHQSVGHLHIHCCLRNLWTENGRALAYKNTPVRHVLAALAPEGSFDNDEDWVNTTEVVDRALETSHISYSPSSRK
jgi:hypothetical protein